MKYLLPVLLLIILLPACKKKELEPSFKATLNGAAYPARGEYANWNNWQNNSTIATVGQDTMLIVSSQWGYTDTDYSVNQVTLNPVLEFNIRGLEDSINANTTFAEKFLSLIKPGELNYCSTGNYGRCASIRTVTLNGATVESTDFGDNTGSTFTITGNGPQITYRGIPQTTYTVNFSCKLYTGTGIVQTLAGTATCIVVY